MALTLTSITLGTPTTLRLTLKDGVRQLEVEIPFGVDLQKTILKLALDETEVFIARSRPQVESLR